MTFARLLKELGPGLITGAADDDPSGIATYSQVGAQFGLAMLWVLPLTFPLMLGAQLVSARVGRVTGHGIAYNMRHYYPAWLVRSMVVLILIANTINLAADIAAMGDVTSLVIGGSGLAYAMFFGAISLVLQIFLPYPRYVPYLKWLTLSLLGYVGAAFVMQVSWNEVVRQTIVPAVAWNAKYLLGLVAVLGTTISPYLFFWQASHEVEEQKSATPAEQPLLTRPRQAQRQLRRSQSDTVIGMAFSTLIAYFIVLTTGSTLHGHGIVVIETSAQAAEALRPIAGEMAFLLFAGAIIGTGMLAVPVLAGSAAYAIGETLRWRVGLAHTLGEARRFYAVVAAATLGGMLLNFSGFDAIQALFWSAVINGVLAPPILIMLLMMALDHRVMGRFVLSFWLGVLGWSSAAAMSIALLALLVNHLL